MKVKLVNDRENKVRKTEHRTHTKRSEKKYKKKKKKKKTEEKKRI